MGPAVCPCCGGRLRQGLLDWHYECATCCYEGSRLSPNINAAAVLASIDEPQREAALREIRVANFSRLVQLIRELVPERDADVLDVGCAHGWFLEAAAEHFRVLGVEPDEKVGRAAGARGLPVRVGFFPDALADDERFRVIVFNDVFEHLPRVDEALAACREHLTDGGCLVLNLPNVRGLFYRCAKLLARLGFAGAFRRMWQEGMPSPHLHYFCVRSLSNLAAKAGFMLQRTEELPAVTLRGLWQRVRYAGSTKLLSDAVAFAGALMLVPLIRVTPSDAMVLFFRRTR